MLRIFLKVLLLLIPNLIPLWSTNILCITWICLNLLFYGSEYGLFSKLFVCYWEEWVFCCWVDCPINVSKVKIFDSIIQVYSVLANFSACFSINYWENTFGISDYNYGFAYFSLPFCRFCFKSTLCDTNITSFSLTSIIMMNLCSSFCF